MNFLTNIIDYLIIYTFLENAFSGKKIMNVKFILTLHSFLCITLMAFSAKIPEWHTLACIVVILSTSFYYKESAPMKILMVTFLFVLCVLSRFLAMSLVGHIFSGTPIHGLIMMMHIQLEQVIEIIIKYIAVFIWCLTKKAGNLPLPKEANMILLVVLIATTLGAYALYQVLIAERETNHYKIFTISLIILFGIHYLILVMLEQFNIVLSKAYESKLALQEKFFEEEYYEELEKKVKDLRKLRHDYRNQLLSLLSLREQSEEQFMDEIKHMLMLMEENDNKIYSQNCVINGICKTKFMEARARKVNIKCDIVVPTKINVRCHELGVLFGNLLDNAIEACEKVEENKRSIFLNIKIKEEKLLLYMRNSRAKETIGGIDIIGKTTKRDKENHGIGLQSVQDIVDKYNGRMRLEESEQWFEIELILYGVHEDSM